MNADESPKARALSYTCPIRSCRQRPARERGWIDPVDAHAHIVAMHPRQRGRAPTVKRWPHGFEVYEANQLNVGPMRSQP